MDDAEPIHVIIGVLDETRKEPIEYLMHPDGVQFGAQYTKTDLEISRAVLLDLADALGEKLRMMVN